MESYDNKKKTFESLARELRFIRLMISHTLCDNEFNKELGKTRLSGLSKAEKWVSEVISKADERYARTIAPDGPDIFYGLDKADYINEKANEMFAALKNGGDNSEQE